MKSETELKEEVHFERFIYNFKGRPDQPTLLFICGIHGNEQLSITAMRRVSEELKSGGIDPKGTIVAITGNIKALILGERFIESDLNRVWNGDKIKSLSNGLTLQNENEELEQIWGILKANLKGKSQEDIVIFDLHTTSSPSVPFITVNDTISNRNIAKGYPVATVFGIEEFLDGPLLSYMNELGFNAIGFEGGQHVDPEALENHVAFIWMSLANQGLIDDTLDQVIDSKSRLAKASSDAFKFFEITHRHEVHADDSFQMLPGYTNFQSIEKDKQLATSNGDEVMSEWNDRIFMPLYQNKGNDGFFIIRRIPQFFLWLSKILRTYNFEKLLLLLPGVNLHDEKKHVLIVNNKVSAYLRNEIFHLFGFRQKVKRNESHTFYIRRERQ